MAQQRKRVYSLTVGNSSTGDGLTITNCELSFDISKMADQKKTRGNSASIEVYNLTKAQSALLEGAGEYVTCELSLGYADEGVRVVVSGQVTEVSTTKNGTDRITQLRMGEGYVDLNHVILKQMVPAGKTVQDVINTIVSQMPNVARGSITGTNLSNPIVHGWRLTGTPREALKKVCDAYRLEYNVSAGVLSTTDVNGISTKNTTTAPVISPTTGLINEPFYSSEDGRKHPKDKTRRRGVQFRALLNTECIPGKIVKLADTTITGFFRINSTRFSGDFRGNDWTMECLCSEIKAEELT